MSKNLIPLKTLTDLRGALKRYSSISGDKLRILIPKDSIRELERSGMERVSDSSINKIPVIGKFQDRTVLEFPSEFEHLLRVKSKPFAILWRKD